VEAKLHPTFYLLVGATEPITEEGDDEEGTKELP